MEDLSRLRVSVPPLAETPRSKLLWSFQRGQIILRGGSMMRDVGTVLVGQQSGVHGKLGTHALTRPADNRSNNS